MKRQIPQTVANFFESKIVIMKKYKNAYLQDGTRSMQPDIGKFIDWDSVTNNARHIVEPENINTKKNEENIK